MAVSATSASALEAGAAKIDLALTPGVPLDGDFHRRGRGAMSIHDPLYVRALYLEEDGVACFLVTADLFAISPDLRARVYELAPSVVSPENIVLVATHTRSGPGGTDRSWLARQRGGRFMPELVDAIALKFSEAMQAAYDARVRCAIGYSSGTIALGVDRFAPQDAVEGRVNVLRVDDSDGNPVAIVGNFGAAADSGAQIDRFALSADFPGVFCGALEAMTTAGTVAFFLNGGSGDRAVATPGAAVDWGVVQSFGETLAARAKALANEITCRELPLRLTRTTIPVPVNAAPAFLPDEAYIHAIEVDRLAIVFLPIVPYASTDAQLRSAAMQAGYTHCMVVGAANDYLGAIAPEDRYALVSEGADPIYFAPDSEASFVRSVLPVLSRVELGDEAKPEAEGTTKAIPVEDGLARFAEIGSPRESGLTQIGRAHV